MEDDFDYASSAMERLTQSIYKLIGSNEDAAETARKKAAEDAAAAKAAKELAAKEKDLENATKNVVDRFKTLGKELLSIADAGVKFGSAIGTSATKGVELELKNRVAIASQLANFNANLVVTAEQQKAAQQAFSDVFTNAREGQQISAKGSIEFVQSLKQGFKSEFEPTAETFRMLTQMGMTTTEQFDSFRQATGRAGLSNNQLATLYNKNTLSFLLYGNSFGKAAANAEKLGVNLASLQGAQESMVTNLDGTIDTVAQMNQLGANIDFGKLTQINEFEGPDALMAYMRATIPENMMQSASTRALFKQFGISVEDYMKSGGKQESAAEKLEKQMTEAASETGKVSKFFGNLGGVVSKFSSILTGSFGGLAMAAIYAAASLYKLGSGNLAKLFSKEGFEMLGGGSKALGMIGSGAVGIGAGTAIGTAVGGSTTASLVGSILGTVIGGILGGPVGAMIGGSLVGGLTGLMVPAKPTPAADISLSPAAGRVILGPEGAFSLNPRDSIVAGTNLFDSSGPPSNSTLTSSGNALLGDTGSINLASLIANSGKTKPMNDGMLGSIVNVLRRNIGLDEINSLNTGLNITMSATEKGSLSQFVKRSLPYLLRLSDSPGFNLTREVSTIFGTVSKSSPRFVKEIGKNLKLVPIIGSIIGGAITGMMEYKESGSVLRALGKAGFSTMGGILGSALAGVATAGNPFAAGLGGVGGSILSEMLFDKLFTDTKTADDMISNYGSRTLVTPQGSYALNNSDTLVAGTNLFQKGALNADQEQGGSSGKIDKLVARIDALITSIDGAKTIIDLGDNRRVEQPRMALAGAYGRYER